MADRPAPAIAPAAEATGSGHQSHSELFGLQGKVALVTGGSRGIGEMIADGLVRAGVRVYVSSRKAQDCQRVADELSHVGPCMALAADLSQDAEVEQLARSFAWKEPRLDILVNNAGTAWGAGLEEHPAAAFDKLNALNVKAPFHLTRLLLPQLRAAASADDPARVINIGSMNGTAVPSMASPNLENYSYAASKAALHMLTRHLAHRLAAEHITVNALGLGLVATRMTDWALENGESTGTLGYRIPLGRLGRPSDVVGSLIYLSSHAGSYLTGAIIPVDGGVTSHG